MRTVLITGASQGFGRAMVPAFLERGWAVLAGVRNVEARRALFEKENAWHPGRLALVELDVTRVEDRTSVAKFIDERVGGRLDCLVNNAGVGAYGALEDLDEEQIRRQMEVNFFGLTFLSRALLPHLRASKGTLINVSSVLGFAGLPLTSAYCASKFAVEGLTESLRFELLPHGVRVALIEPGSYRTAFADSVEWGRRTDERASHYFKQSQKYRAFRDDRAKAKDFGPVVWATIQAAESPRPKFRSRCGREPVIFYWMRRLLPVAISSRLERSVFKKMFGSA